MLYIIIMLKGLWLLILSLIFYVILVAGSNNAYNLQQQKTNMAAAKNKEKEEEKRRLQAEMRRREQELLNKIKEQQKMLESMKHEKSKVWNASTNICYFWWQNFYFTYDRMSFFNVAYIISSGRTWVT